MAGSTNFQQWNPSANNQESDAIIALMRKMQKELQVTFVFSSHDPQVQAAADDTVFIRDGRIVEVHQQLPGVEVGA